MEQISHIHDKIVYFLIETMGHMTLNSSPDTWELIDEDPGYLHINAYNLSYRDENALYAFEREFNQQYEGFWRMDVQPNNYNDVHRIYVERDY